MATNQNPEALVSTVLKALEELASGLEWCAAAASDDEALYYLQRADDAATAFSVVKQFRRTIALALEVPDGFEDNPERSGGASAPREGRPGQ